MPKVVEKSWRICLSLLDLRTAREPRSMVWSTNWLCMAGGLMMWRGRLRRDPFQTFTWIRRLKPYAIRMKRKWARGSPWWIPLDGAKVLEWEPLIKIENKAVEVRSRTQDIHPWAKPNAVRIALIYCRLILSKDFEKSSLIIIPRVWEVLNEWTISFARITLSIICRPSTYPDYSGEIRIVRRGFRHMEIILVMIL